MESINNRTEQKSLLPYFDFICYQPKQQQKQSLFSAFLYITTTEINK